MIQVQSFADSDSCWSTIAAQIFLDPQDAMGAMCRAPPASVAQPLPASGYPNHTWRPQIPEPQQWMVQHLLRKNKFQGKPSNCTYLNNTCKVNLTYTKFKVQIQNMGSFFGIEGISDCSYEAASSVLASKLQSM